MSNITEEDLLVIHNGKPAARLNHQLLLRQNAIKNVKEIVSNHQDKLKVYDLIKEEEDPKVLKIYADVLTDIEFTLQELWNFPKDIKWHRFWQTPKCTCAKMDNEDNFPTGYYYKSGDCPLHNGFVDE